MLTLLDRSIGGRRVTIVATQRSDGDVHPERVDHQVLASRQRAVTGTAWTMLDQVHGTAMIDVGRHGPRPARACETTPPAPGPGLSPPEFAARAATGWPIAGVGDVLRTDDLDVPLAVWAADCATIFLVSDEGRLVGAHGGWRGLAAGVVDVAVGALEGACVAAAVLGPVIHPCCYEFGDTDREAVEAGVGASVGALRSTTSTGRPALDVPAAVATALARFGVTLDAIGPCTGCDDRWFSHRIRREPGRHATIGRMEEVRC